MAQKIGEIKEKLEQIHLSDLESVLVEYEEDSRVGVQNLVARYRNEAQKYKDELVRSNQMREFEQKYKDFSYICGIDEVGRGPLAGPVVAGAVILPKEDGILYLNDSKQLSEKKRDELYDIIHERAIGVGIGVISPDVIDDINILQATYKAMQEAIAALNITPDLLLIDAVHLPEVTMKQVGIVKGDARSASIAAASIVAKVSRDRMMVEYDKIFPEYGFARNKGYGSQEHIKAIKEHGPCPIHRRSFITHFID